MPRTGSTLPFPSPPFSDALQCVKYGWILYVIWNQYVIVFVDRGNVRIVLFELPCRPDDDAVFKNSQVRIQCWDAAFHQRGHDRVVLGHVVALQESVEVFGGGWRYVVYPRKNDELVTPLHRDTVDVRAHDNPVVGGIVLVDTRENGDP